MNHHKPKTAKII